VEDFSAELIGTAILILLGDGVVANVLLPKTNGEKAGWIVISFGWGMAVFVAVLCVGAVSGAHINPAVTIAMAAVGKITWQTDVPIYLSGQLLGAMLGAALVYAFYRDHYHASDDADAKLATFCTGPKIRNMPRNFLSEVIGTFVLVFAVLMALDPSVELIGSGAVELPDVKAGLGALGALPVGLVVLAIGLSLGGTTGYAINPARDLGPRLVHWLLPIPGKRDSDWSYAWVPVAGPIVGGLLAVFCKMTLFGAL